MISKLRIIPVALYEKEPWYLVLPHDEAAVYAGLESEYVRHHLATNCYLYIRPKSNVAGTKNPADRLH